MPYPKLVEIDGQLIPEVDEIDISVQTPTKAPTGWWGGFTKPAAVILKRKARSQPMIDFFRHTIGYDAEYITGKIVLADAKGEETFTIKLNQAAIDKYEFDQPEHDGDLIEKITMWVWDLEISAGGSKTRRFKLERSDRL